MTTQFSKIWENTDGCAEQFRCASALYLMSVMSRCYSIIIDRGIFSRGHGKEVVDGLNAVDKSYIYIYIYQLMSNVQLPGSNICCSYMQIHTGNQNNDVSFVKKFQQHLTKGHLKNCVFDQGKSKKNIHGTKMDRQIIILTT